MATRFDFEAFERGVDAVLAREGEILDELKKAVETNATELTTQQQIDEAYYRALGGGCVTGTTE